jgi:hypothetical protein
MKDNRKGENNEVTMVGVALKGMCHKCGEQDHKGECPENGDCGSTINGTHHLHGKLGHKAKDSCENKKNADKGLQVR